MYIKLLTKLKIKVNAVSLQECKRAWKKEAERSVEILVSTIFKRYIKLFFNKSLVYLSQLWLTFAPVADQSAQYLRVSLEEINWLSLVYMVVAIPLSFGTTWMLDTLGLRITVRSLGYFCDNFIEIRFFLWLKLTYLLQVFTAKTWDSTNYLLGKTLCCTGNNNELMSRCVVDQLLNLFWSFSFLLSWLCSWYWDPGLTCWEPCCASAGHHWVKMMEPCTLWWCWARPLVPLLSPSSFSPPPSWQLCGSLTTSEPQLTWSPPCVSNLLSYFTLNLNICSMKGLRLTFHHATLCCKMTNNGHDLFFWVVFVHNLKKESKTSSRTTLHIANICHEFTIEQDVWISLNVEDSQM